MSLITRRGRFYSFMSTFARRVTSLHYVSTCFFPPTTSVPCSVVPATNIVSTQHWLPVSLVQVVAHTVMSDRQELHPYGLIPVYCAAFILGAVLFAIIVDRIMRWHAQRRERRSLTSPGGRSGNLKSCSSLHTVSSSVNDYGSGGSSAR
jgi:hypothetical protein